MRPESLELESKSQIAVTQSILQKLKVNSSPNTLDKLAVEENVLGGVIRGGQLGWLACGPNFEVFQLKTGQRVAGQSFDDKTIITCAAEVTATDISSCLLMIAVQKSTFGGLVYLFSVQGSRIVHRIDVVDKVTSCCFISNAACKRSCLKAFNGCAAIGTDAGEIFLIDLNLNRCKDIISQQKPFYQNTDEPSCKILSAPIEQDEIRFHVKQTRIENKNLGIRLDVSVIQHPSAISSILSMPQMQMIVVGFENGLLALFNLHDLNALHLAYPPETESPLVKLTFIEPADDPRPCVYIWAFHANMNNFPYAVMHSVSFNSKSYQDGENIYETFQWCRPDLTIPIHEKHSVPISCQSVTKIVTDDEEEQYSLCLLGWTNPMSSFVLVFDLNQWYKEQMPRVCDWRDYPSYLAPFPIEIREKPLDIWLNPKSVVTFSSIQRPEEHFYPTSLSFDLMKITTSAIHKLHWAGLQNNAIKKLSNTGVLAILMPDDCFAEFLEASLIPQLSDQNYHANPSKKMKQEFLLSMALEYNCMSLLRECAQQWADGSHMGRGSGNGLTLSTLTDWIWCQATLIKDRCNDLCVSLFDDSGITIDLRSRKILAHYSRQLKLLADLLQLIIANYRQYIPDEIFDMLTVQRNSIRMTWEYQEVLQWLLNMGLLPEIVWNQLTLPESRNDTFTAIPYPYRILNKFYTEQRQRFYDIDRSNIVSKTNSCKCLYIDSFIERECNSHVLRNEWNIGLGDGLYPPPSLQAMLRILLMPGITLENKYMLFVYLFLDLHMVLEGEHFNVVQNLIKFPAVFKLNSSLIKTTQAFWNLDHNEYEIALKELISPLTSDHFISQWQQELLVNTLLLRDMANLALQAIRAPGPPINSLLRIRTLLANNLVTEAFELQRAKFDENLLMEFFKGCHENKKWNYVLGLSLTEHEGEILCKFLKTCDSLLSENLQLLYLLQRNKYIEALTYLDDLKHKPRSLIMHQKLENTQDLIISSYQLAMNSTDRTLSDQYMAIKNRLHVDVEKDSDPVCPLSSELNPYIIDTNANVVGSVFHRAIVSAKRTGFNCDANKNHIPLLGNIRIEFDSFECEEYKPVLEPKPYAGQLKRRQELMTYEILADPDQKQPAAKRQRTDSFSMFDYSAKKHAPGINNYLLSSLANQSQMTKKQQIETAQDFDETIEIERDQRNSLGELCETVNLLSTPVVKSSRMDKHSQIESRCQTPQSILKQRHTDIGGSQISRRSTSPSLTVNSARRSVDFNAKPFCYTIPANEDEYRLDAIHESGDLIEDDNSSSMTTPNSIKGRRPIHSGKNSTASNSMDEFYSPETSKVQEEADKSNNDIENDDISRISHQADSPAKTTITTAVTPKRKVRSKTPETDIISSTRITRSRSRLNLDDTGEYENNSKQPVLNTSTPKRNTPRRSPVRSLSKNVIKSNAIKVQIEANKADQIDGESSLARSIQEIQQTNLLKDASAEISVKQQSLAYSADETDATQNVLQDSSMVLSRYSEHEVSGKISEQTFDNEQSMTEHSFQVETKEMEEAVESEEPIECEIDDKIEEFEQESNQATGHFAEQQLTEQQTETQSHNEQEQFEMQVDESSNDIELTDHYEPPQTNSVIPPESEIVVTFEETVEITETYPEHESITEARKQHQNYLVDSSMSVSESMLQKFNRYEHCTSSFFSETAHVQNLLEDSSASSLLIPKTVPETRTDAAEFVVDIDEDSSGSGSTSNNTISSDSQSSHNEIGHLVYEESENDGNNDDDVIQISSSSESEHQAEKSDDDDDDDDDDDENFDEQQSSECGDLKYDLNSEFATTSQSQSQQPDSYKITDLQPAPVALDNPPSQSLLSQEQAISEMIYGDLADAEMLDLDMHNHAFGFEMHSKQEQQNQDTVYLSTVNVASTLNEPSEQLQRDDHSIDEQVQQADTKDEAVPNQEDKQENLIEKSDQNDEKIEMGEILSQTQEKQQASDGSHGNQSEDTSDEIKVLNESVLIEVSTVPIEDTTSQPENAAESSSETIILDPMETEPTNVFENAASASAFEMESTTGVEVDTIIEKSEPQNEPEKPVDENKDEPMEEIIESTEKEVEQEKEAERPKTPAKRTRRAESQQKAQEEVEQLTEKTEPEKPANENKEEPMEEIVESTEKVVEQDEEQPKTPAKRTRRASSQLGAQKEIAKSAEENKSDVIEVKETKSKTKLKKSISQQKLLLDEEVGPIEEKSKQRTKRASSKDSAMTTDRKERGGSQEPQFTLNIQRIDSQNSDIEPSVNEKGRKKRGASQQNEVPVKSIDEPSTSKSPGRKRTKSVTETGLGDTFDAEESASSRRLRKATSHQSLSEIQEEPPKRGKSPSRTKSDSTAPRRAASQLSLSSLVDSENQSIQMTPRRSTRAKSVVSLQEEEEEAVKEMPKTPRTRRAASQQRSNETDEKEEIETKRRKKTKSESTDSDAELGDRFEEKPSSRRLRKAVSHQVLTKIDEISQEDTPVKKKPATPTRMRRAASHQSLSSGNENEAMDTGVMTAKKRTSQRKVSQSTDISEEKPKTEKTPSKSRSRRATSESQQSPTTSQVKEPRKTRTTKNDDDAHSETSSIVSTRSRKTGANTDDETSSVKSSRVRTTRSASQLPAIAEDDSQNNSPLPQEYLESSRLTRSQRAAIEKYSKLRGKVSEGETSTRRTTRKAKENDDDEEDERPGSDHSDTESMKSQRSTVSKASKRSKASEASSSQRTTRSQRSQKK